MSNPRKPVRRIAQLASAAALVAIASVGSMQPATAATIDTDRPVIDGRHVDIGSPTSWHLFGSPTEAPIITWGQNTSSSDPWFKIRGKLWLDSVPAAGCANFSVETFDGLNATGTRLALDGDGKCYSLSIGATEVANFSVSRTSTAIRSVKVCTQYRPYDPSARFVTEACKIRNRGDS